MHHPSMLNLRLYSVYSVPYSCVEAVYGAMEEKTRRISPASLLGAAPRRTAYCRGFYFVLYQITIIITLPVSFGPLCKALLAWHAVDLGSWQSPGRSSERMHTFRNRTTKQQQTKKSLTLGIRQYCHHTTIHHVTPESSAPSIL